MKSLYMLKTVIRIISAKSPRPVIRLYLILFLIADLTLYMPLVAQQEIADSLLHEANRQTGIDRSINLKLYAWAIEGINSEKALEATQEALAINIEEDFNQGRILALRSIGYFQMNLGFYEESLSTLYQAVELLDELSFDKKFPEGQYLREYYGDQFKLTESGDLYRSIGHVHEVLDNSPQTLVQYKKALAIFQKTGQKDIIANTKWNLADVYVKLHEPDSAIGLAHAALEFYTGENTQFFHKTYLGEIYNIIGRAYMDKDDLEKAEDAFMQAEKANLKYQNNRDLCETQMHLAWLYQLRNQHRISLNYGFKALKKGKDLKYERIEGQSYRLLAQEYHAIGRIDSSQHYYQLATPLLERLDREERADLSRFQNAILARNTELLEKQSQEERIQSKIRISALLTLLSLVGMFGLFSYRNNKRNQKLNARLALQKTDLKRTISDLKSTQTQLIQSEKMASLGELTAGIAHEIQNPLNFVNNFSEVSSELLVEMKEELEGGDKDEALIIANDVIQNLEKITHHGKRADSIVKGMLQHSRTSDGKKEATDLNALCDEFLRLSYHGLRAKDKSFNADFATDFDESLGKVEVRPQEMGRVILNLITNAFYAVSERQKSLSPGMNNYHPEVSISTHKAADMISIKISDNGTGIPEDIKSKVFQPFFTTKPTGEGTGLGLSMSYDIVRSHGGELKVESEVGQGTEFIIQLPLV